RYSRGATKTPPSISARPARRACATARWVRSSAMRWSRPGSGSWPARRRDDHARHTRSRAGGGTGHAAPGTGGPFAGAGAHERQFLDLLEPLLERCQGSRAGKPPPLPVDLANGAPVQDALAAMSEPDEARLLEILLGLGQLEAVFPLLRTLALSRPASPKAQEAFAIAVLVQAKKHVERCLWESAEHLLLPLAQSFNTGNTAARSAPHG